jgi:hypothetical protein
MRGRARARTGGAWRARSSRGRMAPRGEPSSGTVPPPRVGLRPPACTTSRPPAPRGSSVPPAGAVLGSTLPPTWPLRTACATALSRSPPPPPLVRPGLATRRFFFFELLPSLTLRPGGKTQVEMMPWCGGRLTEEKRSRLLSNLPPAAQTAYAELQEANFAKLDAQEKKLGAAPEKKEPWADGENKNKIFIKVRLRVGDQKVGRDAGHYTLGFALRTRR